MRSTWSKIVSLEGFAICILAVHLLTTWYFNLVQTIIEVSIIQILKVALPLGIFEPLYEPTEYPMILPGVQPFQKPSHQLHSQFIISLLTELLSSKRIQHEQTLAGSVQ
jgi:hypothetical protein